MIEAQLHGKTGDLLVNNEDILTSSVFGYLQYIPPYCLWDALLSRAQCCDRTTLTKKCQNHGIKISDYKLIKIYFWPIHKKFGEPDIMVVFHGGDQLPICFIIEAKLWSYKSNDGENDQLNRYLSAASDTAWLSQITKFQSPPKFLGLVYLTPRASWAELQDSIEHAVNRIWAQDNLFILEWQDILEVADQLVPTIAEPYRGMLSNISSFLNSLQLSYFHGFNHTLKDNIEPVGLPFCQSLLSIKFRGFSFQSFKKITEHDTAFIKE